MAVPGAAGIPRTPCSGYAVIRQPRYKDVRFACGPAFTRPRAALLAGHGQAAAGSRAGPPLPAAFPARPTHTAPSGTWRAAAGQDCRRTVVQNQKCIQIPLNPNSSARCRGSGLQNTLLRVCAIILVHLEDIYAASGGSVFPLRAYESMWQFLVPLHNASLRHAMATAKSVTHGHGSMSTRDGATDVGIVIRPMPMNMIDSGGTGQRSERDTYLVSVTHSKLQPGQWR